MHTPLVTVVMPVFNGQEYLAEAITSVLSQTYENFELLIIDDGSTDNSFAIIQNFKDARIRIVQNEKNLGLVKTRNRGLQEAKGDYIAMLDCDDVALPQRLALQVNFLDRNPDYGLVASQVIVINESGQEKLIKYTAKSQYISSILFFNNYLAQSSVMIRSILTKVAQYRPECPMAEDYDLWVRLSRVTKIKIIQVPLVKYRLHANNITRKKAEEEANAIKAILIQQLKLLNIKYTLSELELHYDIATYKVKRSKKFVEDSAIWLKKVYRANLNTHVYPIEAFGSVIVERYGFICGNSGLGLWAFLRFLAFPLLKFISFNISEIPKVLFRTIRGYKK